MTRKVYYDDNEHDDDLIPNWWFGMEKNYCHCEKAFMVLTLKFFLKYISYPAIQQAYNY